MDALNKVLFRDDETAKKENAIGMVHTMYWMTVIRKLLSSVFVGSTFQWNDGSNGAYSFEIIDPVTKMPYEIVITPKREK